MEARDDDFGYSKQTNTLTDYRVSAVGGGSVTNVTAALTQIFGRYVEFV